KGYSSGDVMATIERVAKEKLPASYSYEWTAMSLEEKKSGSETVLIFILSIVLIYFILAAQYESFWLPLPVLLSVPCGLIGVFIAINLAGINNNIYVQVGIIILIWLLAKNAILIVEYAQQKHKEGLDLVMAITDDSRQRMRSNIMNSFAFVASVIALMFTIG